jgi:hypothetical protein
VDPGIEFNWPQHHAQRFRATGRQHREKNPDGSRTAWCSGIERMSGMKACMVSPSIQIAYLEVRTAFTTAPAAANFPVVG